jgi:hypothetical protein
MSEEWKPIPGFEGYEASSLGRIRSIDRIVVEKCGIKSRCLKGMIIVAQPNKKRGRLYAALGKRAKRPVAVWVAMAFLGHVPNWLESVVDHKNEDCTDDRLDNLQIITHRKNIAKRYASKEKKSGLPTGVSRTKRNKKPYMSSYYVNGKTVFLGTFFTVQEASDAYQRAVNAGGAQ